MNILAIETSTGVCSIALNDVERAVANPADQTLTPAILALCADEGIPLGKIEGVAVGIGPGMFTSMRVGIATAKTLAASLGTPIVGVPSLDTLAYVLGATDGVVRARIDAGRGDVYTATYRAAPFERVSDYRVISESQLEAESADGVFADGVPTARALLGIARERFERGEADDVNAIEPLYVRRTDAEINWEHRGIQRPDRVKTKANRVKAKGE